MIKTDRADLKDTNCPQDANITFPPKLYTHPAPEKKQARSKKQEARRNSKKMSQMKLAHAMEQMMEQCIEEAVRATFREGKGAADVEDFTHSLFVRLGIRSVGEVLMMKSITQMRRTLAAGAGAGAAAGPAAAPTEVSDNDDDDDELLLMPPLEKAEDAAAVVSAPASVAGSSSNDGEGKERKRTVSKKMKDTFLAMEGGTEDQLKAAMKVYKAADQAQIDAWGGKWDAFARAFLAGECVLAKKSRAAPKAKAAPKAAAADPDAAPAAAPAVAEENFDDEDLEVIEVDGEELTIGVKSGYIFRATEDSGDVKIGVAGVGKFAAVKIPSA